MSSHEDVLIFQTAKLRTSVPTATGNRCQTLDRSGQDLDGINMPFQGIYERLCKHLVHFRSIESPVPFSRLGEGVHGGF